MPVAGTTWSRLGSEAARKGRGEGSGVAQCRPGARAEAGGGGSDSRRRAGGRIETGKKGEIRTGSPPTRPAQGCLGRHATHAPPALTTPPRAIWRHHRPPSRPSEARWSRGEVPWVEAGLAGERAAQATVPGRFKPRQKSSREGFGPAPLPRSAVRPAATQRPPAPSSAPCRTAASRAAPAAGCSSSRTLSTRPACPRCRRPPSCRAADAGRRRALVRGEYYRLGESEGGGTKPAAALPSQAVRALR